MVGASLMTKIAFAANAAGTGTVTIAAPNSNSNRTLILPDAAGELLSDARLATQAEAETGTDNTKLMTPLRVADYANANPWRYESSEQTITNGSTLTLAHGLGARPKSVFLVARCTTAQSPYAVGDEVSITDFSTGGVQYGVNVTANATSIIIRTGSGGQFLITNTGGAVAMTNASWRYVVRAR
jgi:hypothetical protein